jgi:uncharacterized protein YkwD
MMERMAVAHVICRARAATLGMVAAATWPPLPVHADAVAVINELRIAGCEGAPAAGKVVRRDSALDAGARELAGGASLETALARVGYPVASSRSFHVRGTRDDTALRGILAARDCASVTDERFSEVGVHQTDADTWILLATRAPVPFAALQDPAGVAARVLALINTARGEARSCGRDRFAAARPLTLSTALTAAAALHALDMAGRGSLGHEGSDGSTSSERVSRAGYSWQIAAENVAAGQLNADAAVAAWLESPGHCATLMDGRFTETGVAFALAPGQNPGVYWAQVFAAPR